MRTKLLWAGGLVALALAAWKLWPSPKFTPSVQLPEGESLARILDHGSTNAPLGWRTNIYCSPDLREPALSFADWWRWETMRLNGWFHECMGQTLLRPLARPIVDCLAPRLGECFQNSGEVYVVASELTRSEGNSQNDFTYACFAWGAANQKLHYARECNALIEKGITHGVFSRRVEWNVRSKGRTCIEPFGETNRCAVIRDSPGIVKIVPVELLKTYVDAGLISLSQLK